VSIFAMDRVGFGPFFAMDRLGFGPFAVAFDRVGP